MYLLKRISYLTLNQWFNKSLLKETSLQPIYFPSINKENYDIFVNDYNDHYSSKPNQISFLSYDLVGLVYYLIYKNNFKISENIFYRKISLKVKLVYLKLTKILLHTN